MVSIGELNGNKKSLEELRASLVDRSALVSSQIDNDSKISSSENQQDPERVAQDNETIIDQELQAVVGENKSIIDTERAKSRQDAEGLISTIKKRQK